MNKLKTDLNIVDPQLWRKAMLLPVHSALSDASSVFGKYVFHEWKSAQRDDMLHEWEGEEHEKRKRFKTFIKFIITYFQTETQINLCEFVIYI